jgi:hypothetical protein
VNQNSPRAIRQSAQARIIHHGGTKNTKKLAADKSLQLSQGILCLRRLRRSQNKKTFDFLRALRAFVVNLNDPG